MAGTASVQVVATQLCARVPGGTGRYAAELVRALVRTRPDGVAVSAVAPRGCPAADDLPVEVARLHLPLPVLARLWERGLPPRVGPADVVHAPTLMVPQVRRRTPLVVTVHDAVPWTHPETLTPHGVAFHRRMAARAAREAATIVTPTEAVAQQVRHLLDPECRVVAVPSGVATQAVPPDAEERRARLGAVRPYILFVGTAEPRKGLDVLVEAMRHPQLEGLGLVVVGPPGWGDVEVRDLADAAAVRDRVHVTGRVDEEDLAALYDHARAVAMPSRAEGFGFPVLEALSHGVPVVTSDDPALVEVGGDAVVSVPVGDPSALAAALADAASVGRQSDRVAQGRDRARLFSWDRTGELMWDVYRSAGLASG